MAKFIAMTCAALALAAPLAFVSTISQSGRLAQPLPSPIIDRTAKGDRLPILALEPRRVRTFSIRVPTEQGVASEVQPHLVAACEPIVSPLADRALARRVRACST